MSAYRIQSAGHLAALRQVAHEARLVVAMPPAGAPLSLLSLALADAATGGAIDAVYATPGPYTEAEARGLYEVADAAWRYLRASEQHRRNEGPTAAFVEGCRWELMGALQALAAVAFAVGVAA